MNKAQRIALKQLLWVTIRRLGDYWGETPEDTKDFGKLIFEANLEVLPVAIECFSNLVAQTERLGGVTYGAICRK